MLLRSYSFGTYMGVNELPVNILNLFLPLVTQPNKQIECVSEVVSAGLQGRIDFSKEFNLDAYEATIRKNKHLLKENERRKKTYLDFSGGGDDFDEVTSKGGIKADFEILDSIEEVKDAYEEVLASDELKYAVATIKSLNNDFITDYGLDLIFALKKAVKGIPQAVEEVKQVCEDFKVVSDLVHVILNSGQSIDLLFEG